MTDPTQSPPKPRRRGRWRLIVSLALNLVLIGALVGGLARMSRMPPQQAMQPGSSLVLLWRAMPEDERRALRGGGESRSEDRATRRAAWRGDMVDEVAALGALLRAEPFDRNALEARLTEARARQAERGEVALTRMLDRIEAMNAAERAAMVERLERRTLRRSERQGRRQAE